MLGIDETVRQNPNLRNPTTVYASLGLEFGKGHRPGTRLMQDLACTGPLHSFHHLDHNPSKSQLRFSKYVGRYSDQCPPAPKAIHAILSGDLPSPIPTFRPMLVPRLHLSPWRDAPDASAGWPRGIAVEAAESNRWAKFGASVRELLRSQLRLFRSCS